MASPPRFGTDGVRGVANTELTPAHVLDLGRAAARVLDVETVVVGRDPRRSSPLLAAALGAGLASEGVTVVDAGMVPTPAVAWAAARDGVGGAVVTASHNPFADNGVKLFAAGGRKLRDDAEAAVEDVLAALGAPERSAGQVGVIRPAPELAAQYVEHLVGLFAPGALSGLRLVVDCANGAMSEVAPAALSALGAQLVVINAAPDGCNINDGCGATHLTPLTAAVEQFGADAGLAFDGDGDRMMAVAPGGLVVDGDRAIAVLAPLLRDEGRLAGDAVVVTVMSNLGLRRAMDGCGIRIVETPVGDRYVLEALERDGLTLGGEQSGHLIVRDRATTGDGLLAGVSLLDAVARSGRSLRDAASAAMTNYPQVLVNVRTARRDPDLLDRLAGDIATAERRLGADGRVLVRLSGTEPLVRVMVEAADADTAQAIADTLAEAAVARMG